jgi:hypothetical protein
VDSPRPPVVRRANVRRSESGSSGRAMFRLMPTTALPRSRATDEMHPHE